MATPVWAPGYVAKVAIFPTGESGYTDVNVTGWDFEEKVNAILTTHTGSGGIAERIAGVGDGSGTISFNYDLANQQNLTPYDIRAGAIGVIRFYMSASKYIQVPFIIESVPYKVVVDGKVEVQAKIMMNSAAGTFVRAV